jgi:hypothetical protein
MPAFPNHDAEKLMTLPPSTQALLSPEKVSSSPSSAGSSPREEKKAFIGASGDVLDESDDDVVFLNGEPVITTGRDVSRFVVDIRDDGDDALTFRSFVLGTVLAGLGAALCQVCHLQEVYMMRVFTYIWQIYLFKPLQMIVSPVFLLLIIYTFGNAWAKCLPKRKTVEGTPFEMLGPIFGFINPGAFTLKEVCCIFQTCSYTYFWTFNPSMS